MSPEIRPIQAKLTHFQPERAYSAGMPGHQRLEVVTDSVSGKIIKSGNSRDVRAWVAAEKERRPQSEDITVVGGGEMLSGFTDGHNHPTGFAGMTLSDPIYVSHIRSKVELIDALKKKRQEQESGMPIVGRGLYSAHIKDLTGADLTAVSSDCSIIVYNTSYHEAFVNEKALREIEKFGQQYERETGRPIQGEKSVDGHLKAEWVQVAWEWVEAQYSVHELAVIIQNSFYNEFFKRGITNIHDMDMSTYQQVAAWLLLRKELGDRMPIARAFVKPKRLLHIFSQVDDLKARGLISSKDDILQLLESRELGLKLYADGALGAHTALLSEPYDDFTHVEGFPSHGQEYHDDVELNNALILARDYKIENIAIHAIGDRAIARAVEMAQRWREVATDVGLDPTQFRIEHFELPTPEILEAVKELGIWVVPQPNFLNQYYDYHDRLGNRVSLLCSYRAILDRNIRMIAGSDGMPTGALLGLFMALHMPEAAQSATFDEALYAYTKAVAVYEGANRGTLEEGQQADVVVLASGTVDALQSGEPIKNIVESDAKRDELDSRVERVYRRGELVYSKVT